MQVFGFFVLLILAFGAGVYSGVGERLSAQVSGFVTSSEPPRDANIEQLWKAWNLLEENYVPSYSSSTVPTSEERLYGAIRGLTESYGDPYTVFLPPSDAQVFEEDISGAFEGVGMEMATRDRALVVVAPLKDSPAERAGVKSGDIIVGIDGAPSRTMAVDDAVKLIRGKKGTAVTLTLEREGEPKPFEIKIVRDTINIPAIDHYEDGDVYVIELYSFSANSSELFRSALRSFFLSGKTKLLLDLRGNPGGYLEAAVQMASYFLPVGEVVVSEDFQGKQEAEEHRSLGYNVFAKRPLTMAILVDQGSASASEILAGALQQHNVATLVGARTFGKGSVQQLMSVGGGAELKVTIAKWVTPDGTSISDGGLTPDIEVALTKEDVDAGRDPQKAAAKAWLDVQ